MAARPFCRECDGTGWMLYRSETIDGELEEAYRLCPNRCAPRRCVSLEAGQPCSRPGTVRYGLGYYCKEHIRAIHVYGGHNRGSVVMLKYHLVWIPRRRRPVLIGDVADRLEELLREKAEELSCSIEHLAIKPDHLHMFVNALPSLAVSQLVYRLKGYTARRLRQEFPHLRKMPSMWTTAYFASTAGRVSEATIQRYIEAQSKRA
jgi:putative transposase